MTGLTPTPSVRAREPYNCKTCGILAHDPPMLPDYFWPYCEECSDARTEKKVRLSPKYSFDIPTGGAECDSYEPRFASYDAIVCEGDTLEELLANATVWICDQDGGELGSEPADADWMIALIAARWLRAWGER